MRLFTLLAVIAGLLIAGSTASAAVAASTPTGVTASASGSSVVLDWANSPDADFSYFAVRRSTSPTSDMATWTRLAPNYTESAATDSGRAAGTYYYYVTAISKTGVISARSAVASATVIAPTPTPVPTPVPTPTPSPTPTPTPTPGVCSSSLSNIAGGKDPWGGCWPDASTTGIPAGTTLTSYTGPCTVTANNTVIDRKTVNCALTIRASGVQITKTKINGSVYIDSPNTGYSFTITDTEIDAGTSNASLNDGVSAIGKSNFVATRVNTHGGIRGIWCEYACTVRDSYVHGQARDSGGRAHESGVRMGDGSTLVHNSLLCDAPDVAPDAGCSADLTGYGDFAPIRNNMIQKNLFLATPGGTCAYGGSSGSNGSKPYGNQAANIVFTDNVFQRSSSLQSSGKCGYWFAIADFDRSRPGNQWINNKWDNGTVAVSG